MNDNQWLIWSNEHNAWWRANSAGYTKLRSEAGRYGFERACEIVANANKHLKDTAGVFEAMVRDESAAGEQFQVRATEGTQAVVSKTVTEWREAYWTAMEWFRMPKRKQIVILRATTSGPKAGQWFIEYSLDDKEAAS